MTTSINPSTPTCVLVGVRLGPSNPLETLDTIYSRILLDAPDDVLPVIKRVLGISVRFPSLSALTVCNLYSVHQATFYRAFRKLHSVVGVPSPEAAHNTPLRLYHTSFGDYLCDPSRSGKFAITNEYFYLEFAKFCLSWYKTDLALFHTTDGSVFNKSHLHGILPGLTWVSDDKRARILYEVADIAEDWCWWACWWSGKWDENLLSQIQHFDFRCIRKNSLDNGWYYFVNKLWAINSSSGIIRAEPCTEVDLRLLEYMKSMVEPALRCRPAIFPPSQKPSDGGSYFLLGHGSGAVVCWTTGRNGGKDKFGVLNCNEAPPKKLIDAYQSWLFEGKDSGGR